MYSLFWAFASYNSFLFNIKSKVTNFVNAIACKWSIFVFSSECSEKQLYFLATKDYLEGDCACFLYIEDLEYGR